MVVFCAISATRLRFQRRKNYTRQNVDHLRCKSTFYLMESDDLVVVSDGLKFASRFPDVAMLA